MKAVIWWLWASAAVGAQPDAGIERAAEAYRRAVLAGDAAGVGATVRPDAIEMPPGRTPLHGRRAIEEYYGAIFAGPLRIVEFRFTRMEAAGSGDLGYAAGEYTMRLAPRTGPAVDDMGNFVVVARRDRGVWRAGYIIYNSARPAAAGLGGIPRGNAAAAAAGAGEVLRSPFPALMAAYAARGRVWLPRLAGTAVVLWLVLWALRLRRNRSTISLLISDNEVAKWPLLSQRQRCPRTPILRSRRERFMNLWRPRRRSFPSSRSDPSDGASSCA